MEDRFFVYLPSNTDDDTFGKTNTQSDYRVTLPKPLNFGEDEWEVALVEISLPNSVINIKPGMGDIEFADAISGAIGWMNIPSGYYTAESFVKTVNDELKTMEMYSRNSSGLNVVSGGKFDGKIGYNPITKRHFSKFFGKNSMFPFDARLRELIGAGDWSIYDHGESGRPLEFPRCANYGLHFQRIYAYCDFVKPNIVGDSMVPILRVINVMSNEIESNEGTIYRDYVDKHFFPIALSTLRDVHIKLCDSEGEPIKFEEGNTLLVLEFRKCELRKTAKSIHIT